MVTQKIIPFLWYDGIAEETSRVMNAMLQMRKIDCQKLKNAYNEN